MSTKLIAAAIVVLCVATLCTLVYALLDGMRHLGRRNVSAQAAVPAAGAAHYRP